MKKDIKNKDDWQKSYELWKKPIDEDFTKEEISFLKKYIKNQNYKVRYGFYNKVSSLRKQISLVFDLIPFPPRKSGVENNWQIISEREISDLEIMEFILFYFRDCNKRFLVFYYKNIEKLILDDERLGIETPFSFVNLCYEKGYSGDFKMKIDFNSINMNNQILAIKSVN